MKVKPLTQSFILDTVEDYELEDYIAEVMSNEFDTIIEDESLTKVNFTVFIMLHSGFAPLLEFLEFLEIPWNLKKYSRALENPGKLMLFQ